MLWQVVLLIKVNKMTLLSINVPQADDVNRIIRAVQCVHNDGNLTKFSSDVVKRQVSYYAHAARILGFLDRNFRITTKGVELATSNNPKSVIAQQYKQTEVYREWENWASKHGYAKVKQGTAANFLADYFAQAQLPTNQRLTDNVYGTGTIARRAKTLEEWNSQLHTLM